MSETWNMKATSKRRIRVFKMACLRKIEGVKRRDRLRNSEIQTRLNWNYDIEHRIQQRRLKYFGHVVRISQNRFPSIVMHGRVHGNRSRGRPKKRWIDVIKDDCHMMNVDLQTATHMAYDRSFWRKSVEELLMRVDETSPRQ